MSIAPVRLQISRAPGFRLQAHSRAINGLPAVKCDRSTRYGNPYRIGEAVDMRQVRRWGWNISPAGRRVVYADARECVRRFAHCVIWDGAMHDALREELGGHNLGCWCDADACCHVDVLLVVANAPAERIAAFHRSVDELILAAAARVTA